MVGSSKSKYLRCMSFFASSWFGATFAISACRAFTRTPFECAEEG